MSIFIPIFHWVRRRDHTDCILDTKFVESPDHRVDTSKAIGKSCVVSSSEVSSAFASPRGGESNEDTSVVLVNTESGLEDLVATLPGLSSHPPSLYIDLEGVNLGRCGTISILQIFVLPYDKTYLVDIYKLQATAFTHVSPTNNWNLQRVLETHTIPTRSSLTFGMIQTHLSLTTRSISLGHKIFS